MIRIFFVALVCLSVAVCPTRAATRTWNGGGADDNFSTPQNWVGSQAPASDLAATDLIFAGTQRVTPNVDMPFAVRSVTFINPAESFTLSGSALSMGTGGIVNNSAPAMSFTGAVDFSGVATSAISASSGGLSFAGTVKLPSDTLTVTAAWPISFGMITGAAQLLKQGNATLTWSPAGAIDLRLSVNAGTLTFAADGSLDRFTSASTIAVNNSSTLNFNEDVTLEGATLTRASSATINLASGKTWTLQNGARATISGGMLLGTSGSVQLAGASTRFSTGGTTTFAGGANLSITQGSQLTTSGYSLVFGNSGEAAGVVDGSGSLLSAGPLRIGNTFNQTINRGSLTLQNASSGTFGAITVGASFASGSLAITSGASVSADSFMFSPNDAPLTGTLIITGPGSVFNIATSASFGGSLAREARHSVRVENGATLNGPIYSVSVSSLLALNGGTFNCPGGLYVTGGEFTRDSQGAFNLGPGKLLDVQQSGRAAFIGDFILPANGTVQVSSSGATFSVSDRLVIGSAGTALISSGGAISAHALEIGTAGNGSMSVIHGYSSLTTDTTVVGANGSAGTLAFDIGGPGSLGSLVVAGSTTAGTNGRLDLKLGSVRATDLEVARGAGPITGTVNVNSNGTLSLSGAATIGGTSESSAAVNVGNTGAGGTFLTGTGLTTINATGALRIYASGWLGGNGSFQGPGVIDIAGTYSPGAVGYYALTASTSFAQDIVLKPTTVLHMDIEEEAAGPRADHVAFLGAGAPQVTWNGTLDVVLVTSGPLQAGDWFDLFDFDPSRASGTFATVNFPELPPGLVWRTDRLYLDGTIEVLSSASTYAQWQIAYGIGSFSGDDDGDGVPNGVEFLLGTNPRHPFAAGESPLRPLPPSSVSGTASAGVIFAIPAMPPSDGHYRVRASFDLLAWTTITGKDGGGAWSGTATVTTSPGTAGRTNVTVTEALPPGVTRRFYRLEAIAP